MDKEKLIRVLHDRYICAETLKEVELVRYIIDELEISSEFEQYRLLVKEFKAIDKQYEEALILGHKERERVDRIFGSMNIRKRQEYFNWKQGKYK